MKFYLNDESMAVELDKDPSAGVALPSKQKVKLKTCLICQTALKQYAIVSPEL
jgi:hypothetical protein